MRRRFYKIPEPAYLFQEQVIRNGTRDQPEEQVRQWCAFELIRAYGVSVTDIEFERTVRIGSKRPRIDILVSRDKRPWLVVECKKQEDTKPEDSMAQAISYADSQGIGAEFVVCTNGDYWWVKRRVGSSWVAVPDIPRQAVSPAGEPLTEILRAVDEIAPILHKLDEPLAGTDAQRFLSALQRWLHGSSLLTDGVSRDLLWAMDNLLRSLSAPLEDVHYRWDKLTTAASGFDKWQQAQGLCLHLTPIDPEAPMHYVMQLLWAGLLRIAEESSDVPSADERVLRLAVALLAYGQEQSRPPAKPEHSEVSPNMHQAVRAFLDYALAIHLNTKLPDPLDSTSVGDVQRSCAKAWEEAERDEARGGPPIPFFAGLGILVEWAFDRLCFWRRR